MYYAKETDVMTQNWLPICERIEFSMVKVALKIMHFDWLKYLR